MGWWIAAVLLPACALTAWVLLRRPLSMVVEDLNHEQVRQIFRQQREGLEARFVTALSLNEPIDGLRWEEAHWHDEVQWARDRRSRSFFAMVGVHFDPSPFGGDEDDSNLFATAVFEFRKGRWRAEGLRLENVLPPEACLRNQRFVPLVPPPNRA